MKSSSLIVLSTLITLLLGACAPPDMSPILSDRSDAPQENPVAPTNSAIPENDNTYTCSCQYQIPANCVAVGFCGSPGTGTTPTNDGFCDFGIHNTQVCLPDQHSVWSHLR